MRSNVVWEEVEITIPIKRIDWDGKTPIISPSKEGVRIHIADSIGFTEVLKDEEISENVAKVLTNMIMLYYSKNAKKVLPDGQSFTHSQRTC